MVEKVEWGGQIVSVQPRIRLNRSFDERNHGYLGYSLQVDGQVDGGRKTFWIGIGKAAQAKFQFRVGVIVEGEAMPLPDPRMEAVDYYKVSGLRVAGVAGDDPGKGPPWHGVPPTLEVYRARGHRRLSARIYDSRCSSCIWGCKMSVVIIVDQWNPSERRHRFETFCYGPRSCGLYKAGPTRKVPGRRGMTWEEEDWVDEEAVAHRGDND